MAYDGNCAQCAVGGGNGYTDGGGCPGCGNGDCSGCGSGDYSGCGNGGCPGCGGADGALFLTEQEIQLLRVFAEIPFWPMASRADSQKPICLEHPDMTPGVLWSLAAKQLIRLDSDLPLSNFDYRDYAAYPHHGSMALTALGQNVVELLEIRGVEEA